MSRRGPWVVLALSVGLLGRGAHALPTTDENAAAVEALLSEGLRLYDASRFREAIRSFEDAVCVAARSGDRAALFRSWDGLSRGRWAVGEYRASLEAEERALATQPPGDEPDRIALGLNNVGLALYSTGAHGEALDYYTLALDRAESPATRALVLLNIGLVFRFQGRFSEAETALSEALALRRRTGGDRETALILNALGMVSRVTGQYARAATFYVESLDLRRAAGDLFGQAQTLNNLANLYGDQGEFERALEGHRRTLRLAEEIGYTRQIGLSHQNIGAELDDLGRTAEALPEACAAAALYRTSGDRTNLATALSNAGGYCVELGELREARTLLEEALSLAIAIGEPEKQILSLQGLADADIAESKPSDALERLDVALGLAERDGFPSLEWKLRLDRSRALGELGKRGERIADLSAAAASINDLRATLGTDAGKIGFADEVQEVFEDLAAALSEEDRNAEALETAEAAKARALADILSQRSIAGKPADRSILGEIRGAQARARRDPASRGGDLGPALSRLKQANPELASFVSVESPRIDEIRRIAARLDATIVEYLATKDACYAWVVAPDGTLHAARRDADRASFSETVRRVRAGLESVRPAPSLRNDLRRLDDVLLAPIEPWLPRDPEGLVVLIPHGPIALVPFAALPDERGRPFVSRHAFSLSPAASVFRYTPSKRASATSRGLVVADPDAPRGSGLASLSGAENEATLVAARLGPGTVVLTRSRATESAVKRSAPQSSVLHFATHGLISEDLPLASSLVLAEGDADDGYLRVDEILGLDLHADLVVLSGCRTGLGKLSGDGILGFTRAFLYAGTPSIVVSQWDVSDRATARLMDSFYASWRGGADKARALRRAELAERARGLPAAVWASFVLVGEPR